MMHIECTKIIFRGSKVTLKCQDSGESTLLFDKEDPVLKSNYVSELILLLIM